MSWSFLLCFPILSAAFFQATGTTQLETMLDSTFYKTVRNDSGSNCSWNCKYKVNETDLHGNNVPMWVFLDGRLFKFIVNYEMKVEDNCISKTPHRSTVNVTQLWRVRLIIPTNEDIPSFVDKALKHFSYFIEEEFLYTVNASCTFKVNAICNTSQPCYSELSPEELKEKTLYRTHLGSLGKICIAEEEKNQQTCIKISEFKYEWKQFFLNVALFLFVAIFSYTGPYIFCLFPATEVIHHEIRHIILDRSNPVGLRSLIGNYFFSMDDTMWHRVRKCIFRVFILPIPFLIPALFVEYLLNTNFLPRQNSLHITSLYHPSKMICFGCYFFQALYLYFVIPNPNGESSSVWFRYVDFYENFFLMWDIPLQMIIHFRLVRGTLLKLFVGLINLAFDAFVKIKNSLINSNSWKTTVESLVHIILFLGLIPIALIFLPGHLFSIMWFSLPIATICAFGTFRLVNINILGFYKLCVFRAVEKFLGICFSWLALFGGLLLLRSAALGFLLFLQIAVSVAFSEENLPFVGCFILVSYCLWSSYRSFCNEYQELALKLLDHCKRPSAKRAIVKDPLFDKERLVRTIPKELFNIACEELMPIKENTRKLALKVILQLMWVFLVFFLTMLMAAAPLKKTLVLIFLWSVSGIISFYFQGRKHINHNATCINNDCNELVKNYFKSTSNSNLVEQYHLLERFPLPLYSDPENAFYSRHQFNLKCFTLFSSHTVLIAHVVAYFATNCRKPFCV